MKHNKIFIACLAVFMASAFLFAEELPPEVPTETQYFAVIDGQQTGPYTASDLQELYASGQINQATLVWNQNMTNWTPISNVTELKSISQKKRVIQTGVMNVTDNTTDEDYSRAGLRDDEKAYLYKRNLGSYVTNQAAMQAKFKSKLSGGIVLAALSSVFVPTGAALLGAGLYSYFNTLHSVTKFSDMSNLIDSVQNALIMYVIGVSIGPSLLLAGIILGPLCAIPFSNAGKIAAIYRKINNSRLFSALSRTSIGGGYDWENQKANVVVAVKL